MVLDVVGSNPIAHPDETAGQWPAFNFLRTGAGITARLARAVTRLAFAANVPVRARSIATDRKISASVRAFTVMWLISPQCASRAPNTWVAP